MLRDEAFRDEEELLGEIGASECFDEDGGFKHNKFAELLAAQMHIVTLNEQCYVYDEGYYQKANRAIDKEMIKLFKRMRRSQRSEVIDYIKIITSIKSEDIVPQEYIINLKNTRLDLRSWSSAAV